MGFVGKRKKFSRLGMAKGYFGCMQIEAVGRLTVESIPEDGDAQTVWMGAVDTQLMGATSQWEEGDPSLISPKEGRTAPPSHLIHPKGSHPISCPCFFSVDRVYQLARAVVDVGAEGQ